jgi:flagellum-specific ATP synthase
VRKLFDHERARRVWDERTQHRLQGCHRQFFPGRFPAIDVLKSVSRALPACHSEAENALALATRKAIADYEAMATMVRIGAYRGGSDVDTDRAIRLRPELEAFFAQAIAKRTGQSESFAELGRIMAIDGGDGNPGASG